jgi:hypothetical protein
VLGRPIQQIRVHGSSHVTFELLAAEAGGATKGARGERASSSAAAVTGGVILEQCTAITFRVVVDSDRDGDVDDDDDENVCSSKAALDVKDFSFLKRGIPSPNFAVQYTFRRKMPDHPSPGLDGEGAPRESNGDKTQIVRRGADQAPSAEIDERQPFVDAIATVEDGDDDDEI